MMPTPFELESFDRPTKPLRRSPAGTAPEIDLEEARLASYEKGYRNGWDDATEAHKREQGNIDAEFAGSLQSMSFTYHEARVALQKDVAELLEEVMRRLLPGATGQILATHIVDLVNEQVDGAMDKIVEISVSPDKADLMRRLIDGKVAPALRLVEEPSVGGGQAYLRIGETEQKIDIARAVSEMEVAVAAFFEHSAAEPTIQEEAASA